MTNTRPTDLVYGHLGDPTYNTKARQWYFPREPLISQRIEPLGPSKIVLESSHPRIDNLGQNSVERTQQVTDLLRAYPELSPAADLLSELGQVSEAVTNATANHDPTVSTLVAFGKATNASKAGTRLRELPCVAIAAGPGGELIRLVLLRRQQLGWEGHKGFGVQLLTAAGGEQGWWRGNGSPIQQLVFAADPDASKGTLLAVRYNGAISILQPMLHPSHISPVTSAAECFQTPASRVGTTHIVTIVARDGSGVPFADVAFNPWDHHQVATIDQAGAWIIWGLTPSKIKEGGIWRSKSVSNGHIQSGDKVDSPSSRLTDDGWAKILWATDFRTLLVPTAINVPDLALAQSADWILDVKRCPTNPGQIFAVTSTRLFWLAITVVGDTKEARGLHLNVAVLLSWVHYRSPNDMSLHLELVEDGEETIGDAEIGTGPPIAKLLKILIALKFIPAQGRAISASDPYIIQAPDCQRNAERTTHPLLSMDRRICTLSLQPLKYRSLNGRPASGLAQQYMDHGVKFYQLSVLYGDLSVSEGLYVHSLRGREMEIAEPTRKTRPKVVKTPLQLQDDFILPNGIAHEELLSSIDVNLPMQLSTQDLAVPNAGSLRTIDLKWLAESISEIRTGLTTKQERRELIARPFERTAENIIGTVEDIKASERPSTETLLELADVSPSIADIDDACVIFKNLIDRITAETLNATNDTNNEQDRLSAVSKILTHSIQSKLGFSGGTEIPQIYTTLVHSYLSSLPLDIPAQLRIRLDRILREIAAQISLAAHIFHRAPPSSVVDLVAQSRDTGRAAQLTSSLPMRRKASSSSPSSTKGKGPAVPSSSTLPSSPIAVGTEDRPALPTPEPTPSIHAQSSVSSLPITEDPASLRLRTQASMAPQPVLPSKLTDLLEHWTIGADPATYDWAATQKVLTMNTEDHVQNHVSESFKAKRRKHMQERIERWSSTHSLRDRAIGGSQPVPLRPIGSEPSQLAGYSQVTATQGSIPAVMSQPLEGTYGNRKAKGTKGKPKVPKSAGFR
ncbi:MAG: hypothetical protein Q9217_002359 [Psora testacea]